MTAADVVYRPDGVLATEFVVLDIYDGETYTTNLSTPYGAVLGIGASTTLHSGSAINLDYSISSRTLTFRVKVAGNAGTADNVSVLIYGRK